MSGWLFGCPPGHAQTVVAREPDERASQVMSVQEELDAVTVERDDFERERDWLAGEVERLEAANARLTDLLRTGGWPI